MKELVYHRQLLPTVERNADRTAFFDGEYTATFAEHLDRVARLSAALDGIGVTRGDRFAVMALNSHQFLECYHAAFLGAGVINPLNLRLAPKELEYILGDSGTTVCFTDPFFAPVIDKVRAAVGLKHVVMIGSGDAPHDVTYEDLLADATPAIPNEPEEDDPVVLMYTGGTTGLPKGVLLDQRAEMLNLYHVLATWRFSEQDVFLHQTPMFHAASMGGMLGVPAMGGGSVFLSLFDPANVMALVEQHKVTNTVMVPTMIGMLLSHPEFKAERLASLTTLTYGASPMPGRPARAAGVPLPRHGHLSGLRHDRVRRGPHCARPRRAPSRWPASALGGPAVARRRAVDPRGRRQAGAGRRDRRGLSRVRGTSCASTGRSPRRRRTRSATAGTTPATPAMSTRTATCFSSTASRT